MIRQLQIKDGIAIAEWNGAGEPPIVPIAHDVELQRVGEQTMFRRAVSKDKSIVFVNVTDRPEAQVGHTYDVGADVFTAPPPPPDHGLSVDARDFFYAFTDVERKSIRRAAKVDEDVEDVLAMINVPTLILLKHPRTIEALELLVSKGLLTAKRAKAIQAGTR